jgi:hypothetical protein
MDVVPNATKMRVRLLLSRNYARLQMHLLIQSLGKTW